MKDKLSPSETVIVFDLDDTLCSEFEYLQSAFREIATSLEKNNPDALLEEMISNYKSGKDVFDILVQQYNLPSKDSLIHTYRNHFPSFPNNNSHELLTNLKKQGYILGIITDGRSVTQRNKLKSLNIEHLFDKIVISEEFGSEKTNERNFTVFHEYEAQKYYYIGDNPAKDFYQANRLGWITICLRDNENNIHKHNSLLPFEYNSKYKVYSIVELKELLYTID